MKTKAAVLRGVNEKWQVEEIDLGDPVAGEVQVRLAASGLCHSDEHLRLNDMPMTDPDAFPVVGGHEGAGVVTKVGAGVRSLQEGDHVVLGFIPSCGRCPPCSTGRQNLCDLGAALLAGKAIADSTYRITVGGRTASAMCLLGTFSPYVTVHEASAIKIDDDLPLDKAALVGCGVTTGWGSSVYAADVRAGDTVVIVGVGGVGMNAVQGAASAGARTIIAIDPVGFKRVQARAFGATHAYANVADACEPINALTRGRMADKAVIAVGRVEGHHIAETLAVVAKGGTCVVTGMGAMTDVDVKLSLFELTLLQKRLQGAIFGGGNPRFDIPNLLSLYRDGKLKLDELITSTYRLEDINEGYADMHEGRNIRGLIVYDENDY